MPKAAARYSTGIAGTFLGPKPLVSSEVLRSEETVSVRGLAPSDGDHWRAGRYRPALPPISPSTGGPRGPPSLRPLISATIGAHQQGCRELDTLCHSPPDTGVLEAYFCRLLASMSTSIEHMRDGHTIILSHSCAYVNSLALFLSLLPVG